MINYKGISREKLLSELYNNSIIKKSDFGKILYYDEESIKEVFINNAKNSVSKYRFDYIGVKPIFVDLSNEEEFDGMKYDFYNCFSERAEIESVPILSAQEVVDKIRKEMKNTKGNSYVKKRK